MINNIFKLVKYQQDINENMKPNQTPPTSKLPLKLDFFSKISKKEQN